MGRIIKLTSVCKKQTVAVTGALLSGFVCTHLAGNFAIFAGPSAFNAYAEKLESLGALLYLAELGLIGLFLVHICLTLSIVLENRSARPVSYAISPSSEERSFTARLMPYTGLLVLAFIVWHISDFKYAPHEGMVAGTLQHGLYARVYASLVEPVHAFLYIIAMFAVGLHLAHSLQSLFMTFGLCNEKLRPTFMKLSLAIGMLVAVAFSSIPVYLMAKEKCATIKQSQLIKGGITQCR